MIKDLVCETASAPGTSTTFNLAGAVTGRVTFASVYATGSPVYYYMDDGTQAEWGLGTFTTGAPNTLSRTTVYGNTAGTTARLNFTGTTNVFNEVIAAKVIYEDNTGFVNFRGGIAVPGWTYMNGNASVLGTFTVNGAVAFAAGVFVLGGLVIGTGGFIISSSGTPANSSAAGTAGTILWDSNYLYVCTGLGGANNWKRTALSTF